MDINRTLRLTDDRYVKEEHPKKQIYLHHTVGGSAKSSFDWWQSQPSRIATAYLIDRDGTIYEVFDPKYWAWHLGVNNRKYDQQSIGIELCNFGGLVKKDDKLYILDGVQEFKGKHLTKSWRTYEHWEAYTDKQQEATRWLVNSLCDQFNIPKKIVEGDHLRFDLSLLDFEGIVSHCNVRNDKTDVHPGFDFFELKKYIEIRTFHRMGTV